MRESKAFYYIALLVLYSSWMPVQSIPYVIPFICVVIFLVMVPRKKNIIYFLSYLGFFLAFGILHFILTPHFIWTNAFLSLITYSSLLFILIVKPAPFYIKKVYNAILPHVKLVLLLQVAIGIIQVIYGASVTGSFDLDTGDFVEGTIHPALMSERSFSNPMFATNIFFMIVFLIPSLKYTKETFLHIALGGTVLVLASVVHLLLFIVIAVIASFILLDFKKLTQGRYAKYLLVVIGIPTLLFISQPRNFSLIGSYAVKIVGGELPKVTVTLRTFSTIPQDYEYMPYIGLGPGQFTSRASLIGTGRYIGGEFSNPSSLIPFTQPQMSPVFKDNVFDLWKLSRDFESYGGGATAKPFYSWLAVFSEFGVFIVIGGVYILYTLFQNIKKLRRDNEKQLMVYLISTGTGVLLMLGFMENYWEIPQAILWGLVTLILFYYMTKSKYNIILKRKSTDACSSST